jgi:hypothetical protein
MMFGVLANPGRLAAQDNRGHHHKHHHYKLIDTGTFGGPDSCCSGALSHGVTVAEAAISTPITATSNPLVCGGEQSAVPLMFHAFQWNNGTLTDLEALSEDGN